MAVLTEQEKGLETTVSFPILKTETTADGDIVVYGKATDGTVDTDNQIVDSSWSAKAISSWLESGGNLRVQHNPHRDPAGVGIQVDVDRDGDGSHWLKALVVEPGAKKLVEKKALRAFSVGIMRPRIVTDKHARGGRIVDGEIGEISLVDRPANRNCAFTLVKADKTGQPEYVGDTGEVWGQPLPTPDVIAKMLRGEDKADKAIHGAPQRPEVEHGYLPRTHANPVADRLRDALIADKRDFTQAQRDAAADSGAAMPDGSFPIKNGEDLGNAIHLAGHAKNPAAARAHIKRRAAALGMSDQIPDTWGKATGSDIDKGSKDCSNCGKSYDSDTNMSNCENCGHKLPMADHGKAEDGQCSTCHGSGKIREGHMKCPDCGGSGKDSSEKGRGNIANFGDRRAKPFGKPADDDDEHDDDSDDDDDDDKKPSSDSDSAPDEDDGDTSDDDGKDNRSLNAPGSEDGMKCACGNCGTKVKNKHAFCPGCGSKLAWPATTKKRGDKPTQIVVEGEGDKDGDGDGLFDADGDGDGAVARRVSKRGLVRGDGDVTDGARAKTTTKVPAHREPDGPQNEIFEEDAGLTDGDERREGDSEPTPTWGSRKTAAPYGLMRVHDTLCAAYDMDAVRDEYPSIKSVSDVLAPVNWRDAALEALQAGDYDGGEYGLFIARMADTVSSADHAMVEDARAALHKGFASMYPGVHLSPGSISPSQFQRPYISAGHQHESAEAHGSDPKVALPPQARPASSFTRGPLTGGHERPSPGNSAQGMKAAPTPQVKHVQDAMIAIHDYTSSLYGDLCPMTEKAADAGTPARPAQRAHKAARQPQVIKAVQAVPAPDYDIAEVIKTAAAEGAKASYKTAREELDDAFAQYTETIRKQQDQLDVLTKQLDILGAQPDPKAAPIRSAPTLSGPPVDGVVPAERRSLVQEDAERQRDEKLLFLKALAGSGDPVVRGQAESQIKKMLTA